MLEIDIDVLVEIVEANHLPALLQECAGEMEPDESGSAGHEYWIHEAVSGVLLVCRWYGFQRRQGEADWRLRSETNSPDAKP